MTFHLEMCQPANNEEQLVRKKYYLIWHQKFYVADINSFRIVINELMLEETPYNDML